MPCTRHRVFMATLIVTAKYLNDSSPKNVHWAKYAQIFTVEEINLMEKQLLDLLGYDLRFDEEEACTHFAPFMSTDAQNASTRALAVDKVTKASRARVQAQLQEQPTTPPYEAVPTPHIAPPTESSLSTSSSKPSVKEPTKRPSPAQLPTVQIVPSPVRSTFSAASSCSTSSSEVASMVDDTGSSSGSSSGWMSSDSDSETGDHEPYVYSSASRSSSRSSNYGYYPELPQEEQPLNTQASMKKPFILRPTPVYAHRNPRLAHDRSRKPSDTSSVCTVTGNSPSPTSLSSFSSLQSHSRRTSAKRSASISAAGNSGSEWGLSSSVTLPSMARTGVSGGFLSRMWGAAKGQALGQDKSAASASDSDDSSPQNGQGQSAFRRLVLAHSRSSQLRGAGSYDV